MNKWETLKSMAYRTGFSVKTLRNWVSSRNFPIPLYRLRGEYRVQVADVNLWVQNGRVARTSAHSSHALV
jgi:hypothetical protein